MLINTWNDVFVTWWWTSSLCPGMACWEQGGKIASLISLVHLWGRRDLQALFSLMQIELTCDSGSLDSLSILPDPGPLLLSPSHLLDTLYLESIPWPPLCGDGRWVGLRCISVVLSSQNAVSHKNLRCLRLLEIILCAIFLYSFGLNAFWKLTWETSHHFIIFLRQWVCNSK